MSSPGIFSATDGRDCSFGFIWLLLSMLAGLSAPHIARAAAGPDASLPSTLSIDLGGGVAMEFVLIRPGSFSMGTATHDPDEGPPRKVTLTRAFYLGKFEVTQGQWQRVMGFNPSSFPGPRRPVEGVNWFHCQRFLEALCKQTGRRFSLPTEAQWEYACRAGSTTEYAHGDGEEALGEYAWYSQNSALTTHPVGEKKPNAWGLHDMAGNVYEWCADWYSEGPFSLGDAVDPVGPAQGRRRVLRGGGWIFVADNLRSSDRGFSPPDMLTNEYGFRCVLLADEPAKDHASEEIAKPAAAAATVLSAASGIGESVVAAVEEAIAESDRLRAEFILGDLIMRAGADARVERWQQAIAALPYPPKSLSVPIGRGVTMEFILIVPGTFVMGSDEAGSSHEKPAHRVTITRPFYLGKYEVTQRQWEVHMSRNDSAFPAEDDVVSGLGRPVEMVNWPLAQSFLQKLNDAMPGGGFRLPSEAEWEYACRAGSSDARPFAGDLLGKYAWYSENSGGSTHPVGRKKPNAWGLHDMYGNVWEWCEDRFGPYTSEPATDPAGPLVASPAGTRVARGGAWNNLGKYVTSSFRHDATAAVPARYYGFRCAASVKLAGVVSKP